MDAQRVPLTPLDHFRQFIRWNPWYFWGLANSTRLPITSGCQGLLYEEPWQIAEGLSRGEIRHCLLQAEQAISQLAGFRVAPQYDERTLDYPRPGQSPMQYGRPRGADGRWLAFPLGEGHIQALGVETLTVIQANKAVAYSDSDGDGVDDTFTVTAATTVTDPLQIAVYFSSTERYDGTGAGDRWRVQPVRVAISGGTATITGPKWLLVKPALYARTTMRVGVDNDGLDFETATNFVTTLDVYRRHINGDGTTNETAQALLYWESSDGCCGSTDSSTDPAAIATAVARVGIRNAEFGVIFPGEATYDSTNLVWSSVPWDGCRQPDRVLVRFLAGYPLQTRTTSPDYGQMDAEWRETACMLAAANLTCPAPACDGIKRTLLYWQTDLARADAAQGSFATTQEVLNCPWGTRRGQVMAWRRTIDRMHTPGLVPG